MPGGVEQFWEQEYSEYEESSWLFKNSVFWRSPAHLLVGTPLFQVFEQFCATFSDHPDEHNTVFYLFERVTPSHKLHSVFLRCSNFEHGSTEDMRALTEFLDFAGGIICNPGGGANVELLDGYGEKLEVTFCEPREEIVSILQDRFTRKTA